MLIYKFALLISLLKLTISYELNTNCVDSKYWCQSIENAKECDAFKHCLQTVWSVDRRFLIGATNNKLTYTSPMKCSNCVECLTSNNLHRCPFVRNYHDEVGIMMSRNVDKYAICHLLDQCDSNSIMNIDNVNADPRFECGIHPRNWCDSISNIRKCNAMDYCLIEFSAKKATKIDTTLKYLDDEAFRSPKLSSQQICGFCIFVFDKVQAVLQQNSTEEAIQSYLEGACNLLMDKDIVTTCINQVEQNIPEIYNFVRTNTDPGIICRVLKACKDEYIHKVPTLEEKAASNEVLNSLKGISIKVEFNENSAIVKKESTKSINELSSVMSKTAGVGCELCQIVLTAAKYLLMNKVNETKVIEFIEKELCAKLGQYNDTCVDYVEADGAAILKLIAKDIEPAIICKVMGLCLKVQVSETAVNDKFFDLNVRDEGNCTLCKAVMEMVKIKLSQKVSQAEIIDYIDKNLCEKAGNSKQLCKSLIDSYAPLFFEMLSKGIHPSQICVIIGMCPALQSAQSIPMAVLSQSIKIPSDHRKTTSSLLKEKPTDSLECSLCVYISDIATEMLKQNKTQQQITEELELACNLFPAKHIGECLTFVDKYAPDLIQIILAEVDSRNACKILKLCD